MLLTSFNCRYPTSQRNVTMCAPGMDSRRSDTIIMRDGLFEGRSQYQFKRFFVCAGAGTYIMVSICKSFVRRLHDGEILCGVVVTEILIHVIRFINAEVGKVRL